MLTIFAFITVLEAAPPSPPKGFDFGIWYALIVIGVGAFVLFYAVKRISDIVIKRKTEALIREVGDEPKPDDDDKPSG